jgi:hypothetical protein
LDKLPPKIREHAEGWRETAHKDTWLEGEKADLLGFVDFGQLAQIVILAERNPLMTIKRRVTLSLTRPTSYEVS